MTEQSSSKSFFGRYLRYKIDQQKTNLLLCCVLNILTLPLLALAMKKGVFSIYADLYNVGRMGAAICAVFIVIMAAAGAVMSFEFYNKKNLTDTLGVLPITYKQRFFGDLISGYITNVAPIIPFGIVSLVIFSIAQKNLAASFKELSITEDVSLIRFGVNAFVTFFFIVSITYFITVFVTSACGKVRHAIIFSVFLLAALPLMTGGIAGFVASSILSVDFMAVIDKTMLLFPPLKPLVSIINSADVLEKVQYIDGEESIKENYIAFDPVCIIVWMALAVLFIALAYFTGKRRKPENVGSAFVIRPIFNVICALASGGFAAVYLGYTYRNMWFTSAIAVIGGGVVCVVLLLLYLPKIKHLLFGAISGIGTVLAVFGLCVLFDKTGCFGARYLPENSEKIEYVISNDFLKITDKADIEKFMSMQNGVLKKKGNDMMFDSDTSAKYSIEYKLTNGKTVNRVFYNNYINVGISTFHNNYPTDLMLENEMRLENYPEYFFNAVKDNDYKFSCVNFDTGKRIELSESEADEFVDILYNEAKEKFYHETNDFAYAVFANRVSFPIQMSFGKSIGYLEGFSDEIVDPEKDETYISITYYYGGDKDGYNRNYISVSVPLREKNNDIVKELESYFDEQYYEDEFDDSGYDTNFTIYKRASYSINRLIRKEDTSKVLELMLEMIEW